MKQHLFQYKQVILDWYYGCVHIFHSWKFTDWLCVTKINPIKQTKVVYTERESERGTRL